MRTSILATICVISCVLLCQQFSAVNAQTAADLPFLREQSIRAILSSVGSAYQIKLIQTTLQSDGSFSDINYVSQDRVAWPAADHWQRLMYMAEAYSLNTSTWYQSSGMKANFSKALDYWFSGSFVNTNPNWWFNQIGIPTTAGPACLLMRNDITQTQRQNCLVIGARANWTDWTGQNVMWQAEARLFFALMTDDFDLVMACVEAIKSVLVITPGLEEGIKVDGAFLQHGPQIYNGGYGTALTSDILNNVIPTLSGTAFDLSGSSIEAFAKVFLDGHQWMINTFGSKNTWHTIPLGRQISRYNGVTASMPPINYVRLVTGSRSSEWVAFADRFQRVNNTAPLVGNKAYWTADYAIHNRESYSIGVRMYSKRTYNAECVNEEGKKSMKLSDGSMFIYTGGLEYTNIYGAFDWEKIPGITSEVNSIPFICNSTTNNIQVRNSKITFAGTVSNGNYGLSGYSYLPPPSLSSTLKFKKSWFYFDNEIVVLASGISTNSSYQVLTTLDQRRVNGPIYTSSSSTPLVKGLHDFTSDWWIHHDSVGYVLPEIKNGRKDLTLHVENVNKTGSWSAINIDGTANDNVELFTTWIEGQSPNAQDDYHQLIVLPGVSYSDFPARRDSAVNDIQILSNTPQLQAVYHKSLNILSGSFFFAGNVSANDWTVTVDAPCLVMLSASSNGLSLSVADPTQNLTSVTIYIDSNQALQCNGCTTNGSTTSLTVTLPSGDYAGSSALVSLQSVGNNGGQPTTGSVPGQVSSSAESCTLLVSLVALIISLSI